MKSFLTSILSMAALLLMGFQSKTTNTDPFYKAQWIGMTELDNSMKVVPAVHGKGDKLGNKAIERSIVPMFRKDLYEPNDVKKATIYISGLGHYKLFVNGKTIGDQFLAPGWTLYEKRCLYNTYDITEQIKKGNNAIGVLVGNGFFNVNRERYRKMVIAHGYPRLIFNIVIELKDGTIKNISSDATTKVTPSPITFSSIYGGEDYDARLEQMGWNDVGFNDSQWNNSVVLKDAIGKLFPEKDNPLKIMQTFEPKNSTASKTGRKIYDFGQNASAIIELKVKGNKGAKVIIKPSELLDNDGNVTQVSSGIGYEYNYILKGGEEEVWRPIFSYYGFRYADVEIIEPEGATTKTEIVELKMLHTRNSAPVVGSFTCSDTLFNQIFELINWSIKSNMASVATDCPHREKLGWLEVPHLIGASMHYNYDIHTFYSKIVDDMIDSQTDNGLVPNTAPEYHQFTYNKGFRDSPEWGSASVIVPWLVYKWYGDKEVLAKAYPMMEKYMSYLQSRTKDNILNYGLGDWYDLGPKKPGESQLTPKAITATAIYYYDLKLLEKMSVILKKKEEVKRYNELSTKLKSAFIEKFYNTEKGVVSTGSQTAYAMALYMGLIPDGDKEKVFENLVESIAKNEYRLTTGDVGYHFLVSVLSANGRSDILFKMNNRSDVPGYGCNIKEGATALTESWTAIKTESNNHMMLGHLMEWFYSGLGGISQTENSIAYNNIIIAPKPVGDLKWVKCSYKSPKGIITSNWEVKDERFYLNVEIPKDAKTKIFIPVQYSKISCVVQNMKSNKLVKVKIKNGSFSIGAGTYQIVAQ
ncbi:family 78 glycoside hydrolase catalytic domain [Flavobacterium sp.]|uniref:alpha-L-rhamnosidase n=1 Tax=Flavobacterium sp. TaxID=239 RepID=UPI00286DB6E1|nr:family 78 glycoside hydrolase catalytic domain [Flavobacterium sp.]